ncbi:MAG: type II secretion system F family protein [Nitrospirota bacterium]|nr:type II secretion system F family protein [Nitrospirota bacterium]MDH5768140.1 type II secretion system F family protein [Nitrospirota bacterium]
MIYSYRATTMEGTIVEGVIDAADEKTAIERLKNTGVIPLKVAAPKEGIKKRFTLRSSKGDLLTFTTELSALLSSGVPLDRSLNILSGISESKEMKNIIQSILKSIREGSSFSDALQRHPEVFPKIYINMIRAGEAGGVLDVVLDKLNEFLESAKALKEHVVSAMIYPTVLIVTGGISVIILLTYVLPKFTVLFAELGGSLPLSTQILLTFSNNLKSYWWIVLSLFITGWLIFKHSIKSETGRYKWDSFKLKLMGDVIRKLETARFCRTLGTLLKSGVPLLQALNNAKDVINNQVIASVIDDVSKGAKEGKGIALPLTNTNVFPPLALSMIKVGEETGQLDIMLMKVASTYEKSLKEAVKRFVSLLEPVMILTMGLIIGFIVVSMLMAIFSITALPF